MVDVTASLAVTDAELVARARGGESWAEEMIYRRHVARVASVARRLLRDPVEAADVVQDTFLIAFSRLGTLTTPAALAGWLGRIAVSRVQRRWRWRRLRFWAVTEAGESLAEVASPDLDPAERAELALLDARLTALPPKLRVPWILRHVVGYSLDEVASACDCSLASVKRHLTRAEAALAAAAAEVTS
ncbi:MAG TPA: sigma-70 family RNA polymerase sigma factor [Kofleriaceae bacterium]|nr:sigma-70 family RNA polymerase sigma factor [Kofleriaceae bacterium]